jgi:hypothetical protein
MWGICADPDDRANLADKRAWLTRNWLRSAPEALSAGMENDTSFHGGDDGNVGRGQLASFGAASPTRRIGFVRRRDGAGGLGSFRRRDRLRSARRPRGRLASFGDGSNFAAIVGHNFHLIMDLRTDGAENRLRSGKRIEWADWLVRRGGAIGLL